ncbi:MAG: MCP four helix bundle domain-containing protein [Chloroflexi bacterium]|nr:MCP four helix bundle domain-containing protein [Chloroflexota bacterium]
MRVGVRGKLLGSFGLVLGMLALIGTLGLYQLGLAIRALHDIADDDVVGLTAVFESRAASLSLQRDLRALVLAFTPDEKQRLKASQDALDRQFQEQIAKMNTMLDAPEERQVFERLMASYKEWGEVRKTITDAALGGDQLTARTTLNNEDSQKVITVINEQVSELVRLKQERMAAVVASRDQSFAVAQALMLGAIGLSLAVGFGVAFVMARGITRRVTMVQDTLTAMANEGVASIERGLAAMAAGDLTVAAHASTKPIDQYGADEIGQTARVTNDVLQQMQATITSYEEARTRLAALVGTVQDAAVMVAESSSGLSQVAGQAGNVVRQVAGAVQHVAAGSEETSRAARGSQEAVTQLTQAIDGIAQGASSQAQQIQQVAETATAMATGVDRVASDAREVAEAGEATRISAQHGAAAVRETVSGMLEIRGVVADAATKVEQLGKLGEKIGAVVETIDDIAEQTNLLALNAAIEAARAGEHGRGFAVVADEVRKLAERSQRETRSISDLIREVQTGTREAVRAMESGSGKVEEGTAKADQAGTALTEILEAIEAMVDRVSTIALAAQEMTAASRGVVDAMGSISAIVEESTAATEEMAAQAGQVSESIRGISDVAEESSGASRQVSASSEEMAAQVANVSEQAEMLAGTAAEVRALLAQFRVDDGLVTTMEPEPVVARRQSGDWEPAIARSWGRRAG